MSIQILLERPSKLAYHTSFQTKTNSEVRTKWKCQGTIENRQMGAQLAGTVRAILESFQELHCTAEYVHYRAGPRMIVPNGTIRAWSFESEQLARHSVGDIMRILETIQKLPLRSFEFSIEYNLEQFIL